MAPRGALRLLVAAAAAAAASAAPAGTADVVMAAKWPTGPTAFLLEAR
jgi:hypothetical protein